MFETVSSRFYAGLPHPMCKKPCKNAGKMLAQEMGLCKTRLGLRPFARPQHFKKENHMAAGMTKTQLVRMMAEKMEVPNKKAASFLELLADTAVKQTKKDGVFVLPGLGRLVKAHRKARIGRNPQTGEEIKIKAKTVVKFRVAKAAKDAIAPAK